jgi:hypothetical protein
MLTSEGETTAEQGMTISDATMIAHEFAHEAADSMPFTMPEWANARQK